MEKIIETRTIPEQTIDVEVYIANDGERFTSEEACRTYENQLQFQESIQRQNVFRYRRQTVLWPDDEKCNLYFIENEDDYNFLMAFTDHGTKIQDDFVKFGPGFYLMVIDDYGDSGPKYRLLQCSRYVDLLDGELTDWKTELTNLKIKILEDVGYNRM